MDQKLKLKLCTEPHCHWPKTLLKTYK